MLIDAMTDLRQAFRQIDGPDVPRDLAAELAKFYRADYLEPLAALMPIRPIVPLANREVTEIMEVAPYPQSPRFDSRMARTLPRRSLIRR
jgi:hypothetical protein